MSGDVAVEERWNHNIEYHRVVLEALPAGCRAVLDVGCGEGLLALAMSEHVGHVTGIDVDEPTVELARRHADARNIDYVVGDVLTHPFEAGSFDAVVSIAVIHHIGLEAGLTRMAELVRPGGTLVVVGLAAGRTPIDLSFALAGAVATRRHERTRTRWETVAPKVWPVPHSWGQARRTAKRLLPGVRYRRHVLWRYSLVWTKPT